MSEEKHIFDLSRCPHPMSKEFVLMDDELYYECDKYEEYTQRATAAPKGQEINSDIPCECVTDEGDYCRGTVELKRLDIPKEIHWECQKCGDQGAIINFEDTYWDKSDLSQEQKEKFLNQNYSDDKPFGYKEFEPDQQEQEMAAAKLDTMFQDMSGKEFADVFNQLFGQFDSQLVDEMLGIPADTLTQLFIGNWQEPGAPIYIRDDISNEDASQSLYFDNARSFVQLLAEQESFTATQAGNLKRKTVEKLIKTCQWPEDYLDKIYSVNKVINEQDVWLLHKTRVLLELARLIQLQKGTFLPIKKRLHLLQKDHAGKLFQRLFCTYFLKMNMGYRSGGGEVLQDGLPYSLYRLDQCADEWVTAEELFDLILLPEVKVQLGGGSETSDYHPGISSMVFSLLRALVYFGVLELRKPDEAGSFVPASTFEYRKTPLFNKVIEFNIQ